MDFFDEVFSDTDSEEEDFYGFENIGNDGSDEEAVRPRFVWSRRESAINVPPFTPTFGPRNRPKEVSPLDFFTLYFTEDMVKDLVKQTNLYVEQSNAAKDKKDQTWFDADGNPIPTTVEEIWAFLGVMIMMGIIRLPSIRDYWNESEPFLYQAEIAKIFPRPRFEAILRYIHVNDNSKMPEDDSNQRLYKIQPLIDALSESMLKNYQQYFDIQRELSIDEAMIKYKGRLNFVQYMPMKPVKRGIKVFCLNDAVSGLMVKFQVYSGKQAVARADGAGAVDGVVLDLLEPVHNMNHFVFMDNWFSSISLFDNLKSKGLYACGTLRSNRKEFPQCLKGLKLTQQGESVFAQSNNFVVVLWKDKAKNKPVTVLSTMYPPSGNDTVKRRVNRAEVQINRPPSIGEYNKYMGGVDHHDQHRSYYTVSTRRMVKWWKYIFLFIFDIAIVNSFILYKQFVDKPDTHYAYRLQLAKSLINNFTARKRLGRPRANPLVADISHKSERMGPLGARPKECRNCQEKNKRLKAANKPTSRPRATRVGCKLCDVYLCLDSCFSEWHTNLTAARELAE